jgi:glycosyltransferase involved in cell wall biosynthesis
VGGVSRYSQYFLKALQDKVPLMIRWTDQQPRGDWTETIPLDRADISASDTCIPSGWLPVYNVQNNVQQGSATYEAMLREPGLTILHDLNIHPFLLERHRQGYGKGTGWLGRMSHLVRRFHASRFRYFHELLAAHGPDGAMEARNVITADLAPDLPARHANRLVTRSSAAVIVHGAWSAEQLDRHGDTAAIYSMPLGIEYPLQAPQQVVMDLRERCGLTSGELVIVAAGILGHARRLDSALLAMAQADLRNVPCRLILSGTSEQGLVSHLQQLAARLGLSDRLVILGEVTDDEFAGVILLSDVVLHMHYPTSGQTSSTVLRAFSAGKPVLVSDTDAFRDLPDEVAWKVPTGQGEVPVLAEYLVGLSSQRQLLLDMGARARVYVEQHHTWDRVALRFLDIVSEKESWHFPRRPPYQWPLP